MLSNTTTNEFSLGHLLPEDMVYEILTISGHGNWRGPKFIFRIPLDDPRRVILEQMPKIQSVKFHIDMNNNGFNGITYDYFVTLNNRYEIASAEFHGDQQTMIKRYVLRDNTLIHCEHIYCDHKRSEK
jgi:hypothetical protein